MTEPETTIDDTDMASETSAAHHDADACAEFQAAARMSRRTLLKGLAGVAGAGVLTSMSGGVFRQVAFASGGTADAVLVVLSLRGGADGLSLVVPHGDPGYAAARPRIAVPTSQLLAKDAMFGLHPAFEPLLPRWQDGSFAAVHAVGLPQPNRSHFSAMEEIEDADPGSSARTGWLNRMIGLDVDDRPQQGVQVGGAMVPTSLFGPAPVLATARLSELDLPGPHASEAKRARTRSLHRIWDHARGPMGRGARSAMETAKSMSSLAQSNPPPAGGAVYPPGALGKALADVARLIRADVGVEVVTVDYGAWDMHVNVGTVDGGQMVSQVTELAKALNAFFVDLQIAASRVTLVTISEFGRRVAENGNAGLDHGYGNVMLALGAGVRGGQVHGSWPGLGSADLLDGDLRVTRDYRTVLSEVLRARFPAVNVSAVFPGFTTTESVGLMQST